MNRSRRTTWILVLLAALGTLFVATPAHAQVTPAPKAAAAGKIETITFTVEKGCAGSPTVEVAIRMPPRVTTPTPLPPKGWKYTFADNVATFKGGPQDPTKPLSLAVQVTFPDDVDAVMYFPVEQVCEKGSIRWIGIPTEAQATPKNPAPQVLLTDGVPTPEQAQSGDVESEGKGSNTLFGVGAVLLAVAFVAGGFYLLLRRSARGG